MWEFKARAERHFPGLQLERRQQPPKRRRAEGLLAGLQLAAARGEEAAAGRRRQAAAAAARGRTAEATGADDDPKAEQHENLEEMCQPDTKSGASLAPQSGAF